MKRRKHVFRSRFRGCLKFTPLLLEALENRELLDAVQLSTSSTQPLESDLSVQTAAPFVGSFSIKKDPDAIDLSSILDQETEYNAHDLAAVTALGLDPEQASWNAEGRLVAIACLDPTIASADLSDCVALESVVFGNGVDSFALAALDVSGCGALTSIECVRTNLSALDLSDCPNLVTLDCSNNDSLSSLNVSGCANLRDLACNGTNVSSLDVSACVALKTLYCGNSKISSLDVSACATLEELDCSMTNVSSVDVSGLSSLTTLRCDDNANLSSIDASDCAALTTASCARVENRLTVDFSGCVNLTTLLCAQSDFESANLSGCAKIESVDWLDHMDPSSLDVSGTGVASLNCAGMRLETLNVSGCASLTRLYCGSTRISSLDASTCPELTELFCDSNANLQSLSTSGCSKLTTLYCHSTGLTSLDVSGCSALKTLDCFETSLTSLDVSGCSALENLDCFVTPLTSLDLSGCSSLTSLNCSDTALAALDVSGCPNLTSLECARTNLTALDLSNCHALKYLDCSADPIAALDVSHCPALASLMCAGTDLASLDASACPRLKYLSVPSSTSTLSICQGAGLTLDVARADSWTAMTAVDANGSAIETRRYDSVCRVKEGTGWAFPLTLTYLDDSGTSVGTTTVDALLLAPSVAVELTPVSALLTVDVEKSAQRYVVEYSTDATFADAQSVAFSDRVGTISGLTPGAAYYCRVKAAADGCLDSPWTELTFATPDCDAHDLAAVTALGMTAAQASWNSAGRVTAIVCNNSTLTSADLSGCGALESFAMEGSYSTQYALTTLNVSGCSALKSLTCSWTKLTALDVTSCAALESLVCQYDYSLTSVDASGCSALATVKLWSPVALTSLNVSGCAALKTLSCDYARVLPALSAANCSALKTLDCYECPALASLDVSGCSSLATLDCRFTDLSALDLSDCAALTDLDCRSTEIASLDLSACSKLRYLKFPSTVTTLTIDQTSPFCKGTGLWTSVGFVNTKSSWSALTAVDANGALLSVNVVASPSTGVDGFARVYKPTAWAFPITFTYSMSDGTVVGTTTIDAPEIGPSVSVSTSASAIAIEIAEDGADSYVLEIALSADYSDAASYSFSERAKTIDSLASDSTYYCRVKSVKSGKDDSPWTEFTAKTKSNALDAPVVSAQASVWTSTLTIEPVDGANAYRVEIAADPTYADARVETYDAAGACVIDGLSPLTTYYCRVCATGEGRGDSAWTELTVTTLTNVLSAPTLSVQTTDSAIEFTIGEVANASSYRVEIAADPTYADAQVATYAAAGTYSVDGLSPETTYYCRVCASADDYVDSAWTELTATTKSNVLAAPTVTATTTKTAIVFNVRSVENATSYVVEYSVNADYSDAQTKTYASSGAKTVSGLAFDTTYYCRVKAVADGYVDSAWTELVATMKSAALLAPTIAATPTKTAVVLTITGSDENAESYFVEYSTDPSYADASTKTYSSDGAKTISGLVSATDYYFRVRAESSVYPASAWVELTTRTKSAALAAPGAAVETTSDSFVLTIEPVADATSYVLEYSADATYADAVKKTYSSAGVKTVSSLAPSTTYYLRVKCAASSYSDSEWTELTAATAAEPLLAPQASAEPGVRSLALTIEPVDGAEEYVVEYSTDPDYAVSTTASAAAGTTTIDGLTPDTAYYLRVKAVGGTAPDSAWTELTVTTLTNVLSAPTLSAQTTDSAIAFTIGEVANAASYRVEIATDPTYANAQVAVYAAAGTYSVDGLSPETTYYCRVCASADGYVDSDWTELTATTKSTSQLAAPTVTCTTTRFAIVFSISAVENATCYFVEYSVNEDYSNAQSKTFSAGTRTVSGLASDTTYYCRVKAVADDYVDSAWTELTATTKSNALPAPEVAVATTKTAVVLNIAEVDGADYYVVEYSVNADYSDAQTKTFSAGVRTLAGLASGTDYYCRVKAVGEGRDDSPWTELVATTQKGPLATPDVAASTTKTAVVLKITAVDHAEKYVVEYSADPDFATVSTKTYTSAGSKTISGLTSATPYYFRVKATAADWPESEWNSFSATTKVVALSAPEISVSADGGRGAILTITPATDATRYSYDYSTSPDFTDCVSVARCLEGVKTITGLEPCTTYYFRVNSYAYGYDESDYAYATVTTTLDSPTVAASTTRAALVLKIDAVEGADKYVVEYSTDADFATTKTKTFSTSGVKTISGLTYSTDYYVRVTATGTEFTDSKPTELSATTKPEFLSAPEIAVEASTPFVVNLTIDEAVAATGYLVEYSKNADFSDSTTLTYKLPGVKSISDLDCNTQYYFRVCSTAANYDNSPYAEATTTTPDAEKLDAPTVKVAVTKTAIVLTISKVEGAEKFTVDYSTDPDFASYKTKKFTAGCRTITGLTSGTTYYVRVRATSTICVSSDPVEITATTKSAPVSAEEALDVFAGYLAEDDLDLFWDTLDASKR